MLFGRRFACGPIVARFHVHTGYSQAIYKDKDSRGDFGRTTEAYASLCIRAFAARILKAGMKMAKVVTYLLNFYPKYRPIFIRELYMHALNITSRQDLVC